LESHLSVTRPKSVDTACSPKNLQHYPFERKQFSEAHRVMLKREYYHLESMNNFDQLPPYGFKLSLFPEKWVITTAAPVRALPILED